MGERHINQIAGNARNRELFNTPGIVSEPGRVAVVAMPYFLDLLAVTVPYFVRKEHPHEGTGGELVVKGHVIDVGEHLEIRSIRTVIVVRVAVLFHKRLYVTD